MKFIWPGDPVGKGRPRFDPRSCRVYTPAGTVAAEASLALFARLAHNGPPLDGPLALELAIVKRRPKRRPTCCSRATWATGERFVRPCKPDGDNVAKLVADALTRGEVIVDDRVIVDWHHTSLYAADGEGPCVEVTIGPVSSHGGST